MILLYSVTKEPPTLVSLVKKTAVYGTDLWLFPVVDDSQGLVLSAETNGEIIMSRVDPLNPPSFGSPSWTTVATSVDSGGENIADHWHVFAHGYHWISFSTASAKKCFLLKLDSNFNRIGKFSVYSSRNSKGFPNTVTNDHFLVEEKNGIAVALFQHGDKSSTGKPRMIICKFGINGIGKGVKTVPADSHHNYSNGGTAYLQTGRCPAHVSPCFMAFMPEKIVETVEGSLIHLIVDKKWQITSSSKILQKTGHNYSMSSMVYWKNNFGILTVKDYNLKKKVKFPSGANIMRYVVDGKFKQYGKKTIVLGNAHRPHTTLYSTKTRRKMNFLITCWDQSNSKPQGYMRVDRIS
ncbi:hypothetical protein NPIRD3C_1501 [Nitrosopumilus piranensis]|uniref:Uncharacterized protein n=1 Tax=Nitrosopumilus piranensis TaxID=1582439 RepID=A0A0C5BSF3_9ARCH|nr:hypothetical protein NPIRD3C_1501 [Nitrosopumilus piranensis]